MFASITIFAVKKEIIKKEQTFFLVQEVLEASAFFGNGHPTIFMTDDDKAEQNALANIWPESTQLLCIFHALQSIVIHQHLQCDQMFQGTPEEKYRLACVALGVEKASAMSFYENLNETAFVPLSDVATSLNNFASDDDIEATHCQTQGVVDQVDQAQKEAMIRETNVMLLQTFHEILLSKSEALLGTEQLNEALMKLVSVVTNTKSPINYAA